MKVSFLILHYNEIELTMTAVNSIAAMKGERDIVIVDNASPNGSGSMLVEKLNAGESDSFGQNPVGALKVYESNYCSKDGNVRVYLILNTENGGFSKGNNIGYMYIRQKLNADFVVALNNDISFPQRDFINILEKIYKESPDGFYLAGPDVYTPHIRSHISPIAEKLRDIDDIQKMMKINSDRSSQNTKAFDFNRYFRYIQEKYQNSFLLKMYNFVRKSRYSAATPYDQVVYNCVLNGACLIFDRRYIEKYDFLFEELTFLYGEEDFLTYRLVKNNEAIRYSPELKTDHVGEGSARYTKMNYRQYNEKIAETGRVVNESLQVYIDYIKEHEKV